MQQFFSVFEFAMLPGKHVRIKECGTVTVDILQFEVQAIEDNLDR